MMFCTLGHLPSFGVKRDAVPGRINETWFKADRTGTLLWSMLRTMWD